MNALSPQLLFLVLGPLFLAIGMIRWVTAGRLLPQARTWLILGVIFTLVAAWLWTTLPPTA
jgi:hypothetical protein